MVNLSGEASEEDLEEGQNFETEEGGDLEKSERGAVYETAESNVLEPLLTPEQAHHEGLAAASKTLLTTEKIVVSLFVVCFVVVQAYFVGRSFRNWIDDEHSHDNDGKLMNKMEFVPMPFPLKVQALPPIGGSGGGKESVGSAKTFEVTSEGSLDFGEVTVTESSETSKMSTRMTRLPPGVDINSHSATPKIQQDAPDNDVNGGS